MAVHLLVCFNCGKKLENPPEEWEPKYCCRGIECGCMGLPINYESILCDSCLREIVETKHPGIVWAKQYIAIYGMEICDPDGWRIDNLDIDTYECTWAEFCQRALHSTQCPVKK